MQPAKQGHSDPRHLVRVIICEETLYFTTMCGETDEETVLDAQVRRVVADRLAEDDSWWMILPASRTVGENSPRFHEVNQVGKQIARRVDKHQNQNVSCPRP